MTRGRTRKSAERYSRLHRSRALNKNGVVLCTAKQFNISSQDCGSPQRNIENTLESDKRKYCLIGLEDLPPQSVRIENRYKCHLSNCQRRVNIKIPMGNIVPLR